MKPFIYVHELLSNSGGIWLGCDDESAVRLAYMEGETGSEVIALVKQTDVEARIEELEEMLSRLVKENDLAMPNENCQWMYSPMRVECLKVLEDKLC